MKHNIAKMRKPNTDKAGFIKIGLMFLSVLFMLLAAYYAGIREGYKSGQIDAINGEFVYDMQFINGRAVYFSKTDSASVFIR